jgi:alpha-glucosidase
MRTLLIASLLFPLAVRAQDERHVVSPNGQIEFRLFVAQPDDGGFSQLAYQISLRGKPMLDTSFMGLDIYNQEPLLGQNLGLIKSSLSNGNPGHYNSLLAEYMQNGSLGRRIDVEVRAYDDGVAFRYLIPKSTPLDEILIHDEGTGFALVHDDALTRAEPNATFDLPFVAAQPEGGWIAITDAGGAKYPRMYLVRAGGTDLISRLAQNPHDANIAFEGTTPLDWPWRLVIFGLDKEHLKEAAVFRDLHR